VPGKPTLAVGDFNNDGIDDIFQATGGDEGWRVSYGGPCPTMLTDTRSAQYLVLRT
jgi:hypothetical protein